MKRWWPWLVAIALATALQIGVVAMLAEEPAATAGRWQPVSPVGISSLPPLERDGRTLLGEGAALIYFWATWCEPCIRHLPETLALAASSEVRIWLVARDETWAAVARYFGGEVPSAVVHDTGIGDALGVSVLPTTFYIDHGRVLARSTDALSRWLIRSPAE